MQSKTGEVVAILLPGRHRAGRSTPACTAFMLNRTHDSECASDLGIPARAGLALLRLQERRASDPEPEPEDPPIELSLTGEPREDGGGFDPYNNKT